MIMVDYEVINNKLSPPPQHTHITIDKVDCFSLMSQLFIIVEALEAIRLVGVQSKFTK